MCIRDRYQRRVHGKMEKLKQGNAELTAELLKVSKENTCLQSEVEDLKEANGNLKQNVGLLENKAQSLIKLLEEKKRMLHEKSQEKENIRDIDLKKAEAALVQARTDRSNQDMLVRELQKRIKMLEDTLAEYEQEKGTTDEIISSGNRDKMSMMKEMSILNDKNVKFEKQVTKYKALVQKYQNEILEYQKQMDLYANLLEKVETKVKPGSGEKRFDDKENDSVLSNVSKDEELFRKISSLKSGLNLLSN
eukprot:TRINITY_DN3104_c0_g1_i9.p1 TRINITY_DN3104_c0_g1~~TRINITY_DN3104_c0_g1_i9.p1  ORF type:complete len:264 (-),score=79.20 TRINITY_DN3104_c0_g1_i9:100-846(-)